jgi:hypothetical protein
MRCVRCAGGACESRPLKLGTLLCLRRALRRLSRAAYRCVASRGGALVAGSVGDVAPLGARAAPRCVVAHPRSRRGPTLSARVSSAPRACARQAARRFVGATRIGARGAPTWLRVSCLDQRRSRAAVGADACAAPQRPGWCAWRRTVGARRARWRSRKPPPRRFGSGADVAVSGSDKFKGTYTRYVYTRGLVSCALCCWRSRACAPALQQGS